MSDKGIIFSAPMVRALLAGRKTQTRRLLKGMPAAPSPESLVHQPRHDAPYFDAYCGERKTDANPRGVSDYWCWWTRDDREGRGLKVPYVPGQRLYVREAFRGPYAYEAHGYKLKDWGNKPFWYTADGEPVGRDAAFYWPKGRPSIHMPRWASRLWLAVTDVRVQQLQDCSAADAEAEGLIITEPTGEDPAEFQHTEGGLIFEDARHAYAALWNSLHTAKGERWYDNPWIVAVTFDVHRGNIDEVQA